MTVKQKDSASAPLEAEDAPEVTQADLARGTWRIGDRIVSADEGRRAVARRGRPSGITTKESSSLCCFKGIH